jgi:transposase InsO family protein
VDVLLGALGRDASPHVAIHALAGLHELVRRLAIHDYIGVFYNRARRHSSLAYQTPTCYEEAYAQEAALAA